MLSVASAAQAASCPYQALPSNINLIQVWDSQYSTCKTDRCVVDRNCNTADASGKVYSQNSYQAFGNFQDAVKTISAWIWNFGGNSIDMSMASYPTWIKYLSISNADTINLPTPFDCHATTLILKDIKSLTTPTTWYSELADLTLENVNLKTLPALPSTLTALHVQRNSLSSVAELKSLPSSITLLNVSQNAYTELSSINWRNLRRLYLQNNGKLTRITNVTFSSQLVYLQLKGLVLSNWIMDANTYQVLNQLLPERMGPGGTDDSGLIGYNVADSTIASDPLDCSTANGAIKSLWDTKYTVCVLQAATTSPPTTSTTSDTTSVPLPTTAGSSTSPIATSTSGGSSTPATSLSDTPTSNSTPKPTSTSDLPIQSDTTPGASSPSTPSPQSPAVPSSQSSQTSSSSSTGVIAGATIGGIALVAVIIGLFVFRRRQQNAKDTTHYGFGGGTTTPRTTPRTTMTGKEDSLNLDVLSMVRIDERELQLYSVLGTGAFADVWLGSFLGSPVAVKKMHRHRTTPNQLESFVREIQLMAQFDSPYIVKLIGAAWTRPSDVKCVMEFMDGGDLRECLNATTSQTFSWRVKYDHINSILEALVYLHSLNIVHRDIKSRNILLDSSKPAKLTDFGISKEDIQATMTVGVGTFRWMAPEVIQYQNYTVAADIYSFGIILSEFDTHRIPYEDVSNSVNGEPLGDAPIMVQVVAGTLKPTFSKQCPPWIRDMAMQCLSHNPKERPTAMQLSYIVRSQMKELKIPF
ncbi:hypothetical protein LEN26_000723 [Aphanomyces euteiches]|nr:hypothetical protein LEN26_000723 [Aphanomyces euteiches]